MSDLIKKAVDHNWAFWICLGVSILLILGGAFTPPPFVIDSSIFIATGEMFGFASLWVLYKSIDKGIDARITKGDTDIRIINEDKKDTDNGLSENEQMG